MGRPITGMNDTSIIILCVLMAVGGAIIYAIFRAIRNRRPGNSPCTDPESSPLFFIPLTILFVIGAYLTVQHNDDRLEAAVALERDTSGQRLAEGRCPPPQPEFGELATLFIRSQADLKPEVSGCTRYAEKPYSTKPRARKQAPAAFAERQ